MRLKRRPHRYSLITIDPRRCNRNSRAFDRQEMAAFISNCCNSGSRFNFSNFNASSRRERTKKDRRASNESRLPLFPFLCTFQCPQSFFGLALVPRDIVYHDTAVHQFLQKGVPIFCVPYNLSHVLRQGILKEEIKSKARKANGSIGGQPGSF